MDKNLIIYTYTDAKMSGQGTKGYEIELTPEKVTISYALKFKIDQPNTNKRVTKFEGYDDSKLNFTFVIDGTGVTGNKVDVPDEIKKLGKAIYNYVDSIHKPYYLRISYGSINFKCHLKTCSIDYVLFQADGKPLRAKVTLAFDEFVLPADAESRKMSSPDMTHLRYFKESDNIFKYCEEIYSNPDQAVQIAKVNEIINFRKIPAGSLLVFPPLERI
ncbi:MAG: hypothetical protein ABIR66_10065 [Saprospiraceae bacterium]